VLSCVYIVEPNRQCIVYAELKKRPGRNKRLYRHNNKKKNLHCTLSSKWEDNRLMMNWQRLGRQRWWFTREYCPTVYMDGPRNITKHFSTLDGVPHSRFELNTLRIRIWIVTTIFILVFIMGFCNLLRVLYQGYWKNRPRNNFSRYVAPTTAKVGTNFADKQRTLGRHSSLPDSGHGV
jgi:hypothetical protein